MSIITDPADIANLFSKAYAEKSGQAIPWPKTMTREEQFLTCNFEHLCYIGGDLDNEFTQTEIELAIRTLKDSTPGEDQIHNSMFRNAPTEFINVVLKYFNSIWKTGQYPGEWKNATIIPILKPQKDNQNICSYRPIALTSCYGKLMEIIVNNRLTWKLEQENLLNPVQFGFRPQRGTNDPLLAFTEDVYANFQKKNVTLAAMIDFEAAFDKIPHTTIPVSYTHLFSLVPSGTPSSPFPNYVSSSSIFSNNLRVCGLT